MKFVNALELTNIPDLIFGINSKHEDLLVEALHRNNIMVMDPVLSIYKDKLESQCTEYTKNMSWDPENVTVFYCDSLDKEIYRCLFIMNSWNYIKKVIDKTLKLRAFL